MSRTAAAHLPRSLSTLETWGFGFTVLLFWLVVAPEVHAALGPAAIWVWIPATVAGIAVILQIRRLALARPEAAGGSPVYVAALWYDRPWVARWAGLAYFHSWAIVPAALSWLLADFAVSNLQQLGFDLPTWPLQLLLLLAIYLAAFSHIRILSIVHLCFVLPSLGLLLLVAGQGLLLSFATGYGTTSFSLPVLGSWLTAYFLVVYTTYGIETAAAFTADSRNPRATLNCLLAAAAVLPLVMVGGSLFLASSAAPGALPPPDLLEQVAQPLWFGFTPYGVAFMLAASMVLACATAVAVAPRVVWQLSRDGVLGPLLGQLGDDGVPRHAVAFAMLLALTHLWMDAQTMLLLGGASWVGFWCVMHLGLWRRRGQPEVLWPHLALALAVIELLTLIVGGFLLGGTLVLLGLAIPFLLALLDDSIRRRGWSLPAGLRQRPSRGGGDRQASEIVLLLGLIVVTAAAGWWVGRTIGSDPSAAAGRVSVILLLLTAFVGIAWAAWTHLRHAAQLQRARDDLVAIIDRNPEAMLVSDATGRIEQANPAAAELLHRSTEALTATSLNDLLPDLDGGPADWEQFRETRTTGGQTIEIAARPLPASIRGDFTITIRDLTARKQAEDARHASEQRLEAAIEAARLLVWELDVDSGRVALHHRTPDMLGYGSNMGPLTLDDWQRVTHPEDQAEAMARLQDHIAGRTATYRSEHRQRHASGEWLWLLDQGRAVARDDSGQAIRIVGTTMDLSGRKRLEAQLVQAQKMEAVGQLAGGVAHDFNNALTAIITSCELLLEEPSRLDSQQREDIDGILHAATRAAELTSQLLAFGRRQQLRPQPLDLNHVVQASMRLLRRLLPEHLQVVIRTHPTAAIVRADPAQLEQALVNLAINARDAMGQGGQLSIEVCPRDGIAEDAGPGDDTAAVGDAPTPAAWAIRVSDTGEGMDETLLGKIFEPFFTTKPLGQGAGLGLAMVYGFVRQTGGSLSVDSTPGEGTAIEMRFPASADMPGRAEPATASDPPMAGNGDSILLVEDEAAVRDLIRRTLQGQGYQVVTAADGEEGLQRALELKPPQPRLIISDLVMPRMGGKELAERLQVLRPELPILFISGYPREPGPGAHADNAPPFLQKPFTPTALLNEIRRILLD